MQTISISKAASGSYLWVVHDGPNVIAEGDPEARIEACLSAAVGVLLDEPLVQINYRGVTVGTVSAKRLDYEAGAIADWVFECFGIVVASMN